MSDFEDIFARAVTGISDSSTPVTDYYNSDGGNGAGTWDGGGSSSEPTYGVTPDERNTFIIVVLSILVIMGVFFIIGGLFVKVTLTLHVKHTLSVCIMHCHCCLCSMIRPMHSFCLTITSFKLFIRKLKSFNLERSI